MNILLIFFALPIAVIIISIALQKILKCPYLVAAVIFAIFLIVTFVINNLTFLVAAIVYTIISLITALIVCFICRFLNNQNNNCRCNRNENNETLTINAQGLIASNTGNGCGCGCNNRSNCGCNNGNNCGCSNNENNNSVAASINVIPNTNNNGRTGCICGSYRRR